VSRFPSRFRCRHSLLGHPMPAEDSALLTVGLPATPEGAPDLDGVTAFRTNELRPGWVPSIPRGRRCSSRPRDVPDRRLPLFRGQSLDPAPALHQQGSASRGINEGSSNSPVRSSPRPRPPGWNEPPLRLPPEASPPRRPGADDARRGWGQAVEHGPGTTHSTSHPLILQSAVHSCDLASHRPWRASARARRRRPLLREAAARRSDQPDRLHGSVAWRLSHKSRALERATTTTADATPIHTAARRINVGGAAVFWTNRQRTAGVADLCDSHYVGFFDHTQTSNGWDPYPAAVSRPCVRPVKLLFNAQVNEPLR
jgi:hypothetical protein